MKLKLAWRERQFDTVEVPRLFLGSRRPPKVVASQSHRKFLDFEVDGASLYDRIDDDYISRLGWFSVEEDERAARTLMMLEPPDIGGRTALYVCAECGDLDCGAITAVLAHEADLVIWRDFAHSWPDWGDGGVWRNDEEPFQSWPAMQFKSDAYRAAIENRPSPVAVESN